MLAREQTKRRAFLRGIFEALFLVYLGSAIAVEAAEGSWHFWSLGAIALVLVWIEAANRALDAELIWLHRREQDIRALSLTTADEALVEYDRRRKGDR